MKEGSEYILWKCKNAAEVSRGEVYAQQIARRLFLSGSRGVD
jgi:hypothetical protein